MEVMEEDTEEVMEATHPSKEAQDHAHLIHHRDLITHLGQHRKEAKVVAAKMVDQKVEKTAV